MGIEGWRELHFRAWRHLGQGRLDFHLGLGHRSSLGSLAVFWMLRLLTNITLISNEAELPNSPLECCEANVVF